MNNSVEAQVEGLADAVAEILITRIMSTVREALQSNLGAALGSAGPRKPTLRLAPMARPPKLPKAAKPKRKTGRPPGFKLDMACRVEGCKKESRGPRHGYMCDEHDKLPEAEKKKARDAYNARKKAAQKKAEGKSV